MLYPVSAIVSRTQGATVSNRHFAFLVDAESEVEATGKAVIIAGKAFAAHKQWGHLHVQVGEPAPLDHTKDFNFTDLNPPTE